MSGTIEIKKEIHKLLDYCATHPDATLQYKASGMILRVHSDASYFSESQARIRVGDFSTWDMKSMISANQMARLRSYQLSCIT